MPDFRIQIERLTDRKERFDFEVPAAWWIARNEVEGDDSVVVEAPFRFGLEASRVSDDIVIEGDLEGEVGLECSRCGKRYPHALREPYRLVLEPLGGQAPDPEGEKGLAENGVCLGEDLEVGSYRGAVVGLDDFFGEVIALAMPLQPLCDEDCPGLCAHCGASQDSGCTCEDEKIESPFAALAGLKAELESERRD
ncbi:MAG: YceD family protein [bacterium]|nr:YceD family protein [bacterium]